jgi:large subunit ribosomal protein L6
MSKIGKKLVTIPDGIAVTEEGRALLFRGAKGEIRVPILHGVTHTLNGKELTFALDEHSKIARSNWGTTASLCLNAIEGLTKGYEKKLILEGVGYRVTKDGDGLLLALGFSHPVNYPATPGITFEVEKNSILIIRGVDKIRVGQVAAEIRSMKKPEPYKGKGFRYDGEVIRRKAGKKGGTA